MSDWLEHSVQVEVKAPISVVWGLWSDLEKMPLWMKWIQSVEVLPEDAALARWTLNTGGLEFKWMSRNTHVVPEQIIQWESVDGLPNRGAVRFYDRHEAGSVVRLTIAYAIPGILGKLMDSWFLGKAVEDTIREDLERFRTYTENLEQSERQSATT